MKIGNFSILFAVTIGLALGFIGVSASPSEQKSLTVGVVLRLSDKYNSTVPALDNGIQVAKILYEIEHPGVKITLKRYSIGEDLTSSIHASEQIIADKVKAVVGGEYSEESLVLGEQLGPQKVVFITPTSSNPSVTENRPYSFRACASDKAVAEKLAKFTVNHLKPNAVGLIHNLSSPYTDFLSKKFLEVYEAEMKKRSPEKQIPIFEEKILNDTQDFSKQIDLFIEKKITHVVMPTHETDFLRFAIHAATKKYFPIYIGADGWGPNNKVYENFVKNSGYGNHFIAYQTNYWKEENTSPAVKLFKSTYEKETGVPATSWAGSAFDAAWILFSAMDKTHNLQDGSEIQKNMKTIGGSNLITTNHFKFGSDNSPNKDLFIYRIDKSGIRYEVAL